MKVIGIGDNVVDDYTNLRTLFPGGNALNFSVYATMLGCEAAYLGVFGNDDAAAHVQRTLAELGVDNTRCRSADDTVPVTQQRPPPRHPQTEAPGAAPLD